MSLGEAPEVLGSWKEVEAVQNLVPVSRGVYRLSDALEAEVGLDSLPEEQEVSLVYREVVAEVRDEVHLSLPVFEKGEQLLLLKQIYQRQRVEEVPGN